MISYQNEVDHLLQELEAVWNESDKTWKDESRFEFEKQYWVDLMDTARSLSQVMSELDQIKIMLDRIEQ